MIVGVLCREAKKGDPAARDFSQDSGELGPSPAMPNGVATFLITSVPANAAA